MCTQSLGNEPQMWLGLYAAPASNWAYSLATPCKKKKKQKKTCTYTLPVINSIQVFVSVCVLGCVLIPWKPLTSEYLIALLVFSLDLRYRCYLPSKRRLDCMMLHWQSVITYLAFKHIRLNLTHSTVSHLMKRSSKRCSVVQNWTREQRENSLFRVNLRGFPFRLSHRC